MVGLQYLFLEPNADDPLNKGAWRERHRGGEADAVSRQQRRPRTCGGIERRSRATSRRRWPAAASVSASRLGARLSEPPSRRADG
jgi:hypothetical protein